MIVKDGDRYKPCGNKRLLLHTYVRWLHTAAHVRGEEISFTSGMQTRSCYQYKCSRRRKLAFNLRYNRPFASTRGDSYITMYILSTAKTPTSPLEAIILCSSIHTWTYVVRRTHFRDVDSQFNLRAQDSLLASSTPRYAHCGVRIAAS
jgi:hypothetical protein